MTISTLKILEYILIVQIVIMFFFVPPCNITFKWRSIGHLHKTTQLMPVKSKLQIADSLSSYEMHSDLLQTAYWRSVQGV